MAVKSVPQSKLEYVMGLPSKEQGDHLKVLANIDRNKNNYFVKMTSVKTYLAMNLEALKSNKLIYRQTINTPVNVMSLKQDKNKLIKKDSKGKVLMIDSVVSPDFAFSETAQIFKSNVGRAVKVGQRSEISNSVIHNNVTIGNDCIIENSVIMSKAVVENGCVLKSAKVGFNQTVHER
mmetsp:Transcript_12558/g.12357  ORF Transcript_12558/g.12357 Transcript_12558/m.12357 type:complete len:178 (+) Transcript_12558:894-1427(+)|eukprot:CAMPEP_0170542530 /NCGR_PEP_ID=MMETSP0211-20121228/1929_1 /TAXON_ID=311385 /ORGANISM="Pseudokeronopsis sp., Strain OXSARD2" /LENGTH=177 /DNA_ID=CAMNT_0010845617 /DNA_START=850 /DNA_END=1383 /DNA_ORIENTATION=-